MTTLKKILKYYDSRFIALNKLKTHLKNSEITKLDPRCRYLSIELISSDGIEKIVGLINLDDWLVSMEVQLPGVPWQVVPTMYIISWIKSLNVEFIIADMIWHVIALNTIATEVSEYWLVIQSEPCAFICDSWFKLRQRDTDNRRLLLNIPFCLRYMLGSSHLPLQELIPLARGDLLQIENIQFGLDIENYRICSFNYNGEDEIIVSDIIMEYRDQHRDEESLLLDWKNLPVHIEFVLDSKILKIQEIDSLEVGTPLRLNDNAVNNIKIYLNRVLFAQGELVLLEAGGLAVEINKIVTQSEPLLGLQNVE